MDDEGGDVENQYYKAKCECPPINRSSLPSPRCPYAYTLYSSEGG